MSADPATETSPTPASSMPLSLMICRVYGDATHGPSSTPKQPAEFRRRCRERRARGRPALVTESAIRSEVHEVRDVDLHDSMIGELEANADSRRRCLRDYGEVHVSLLARDTFES